MEVRQPFNHINASVSVGPSPEVESDCHQARPTDFSLYSYKGETAVWGRCSRCKEMAEFFGVKGFQYCHAQRDGDCIWIECPQLRDGEPVETNRHCPLDISTKE